MLLLAASLALSACGGSGGGSDSGDADPQPTNDTTNPTDSPDNGGNEVEESAFAPLEVHLGFENEASATRINFPLYILASVTDWYSFTEEFRQLGVLVDLWDQAQRGDILLPETGNIPLLDALTEVFTRKIRIVRTDWDEVGEMCGYGSGGKPNNGCAYNKNLPECTIYVPRQELYANGDVNAFHALLGHEMWHCLVGSFH